MWCNSYQISQIYISNGRPWLCRFLVHQSIMVITDRLRPRYELTLNIDTTIARLPSYNIAIIFFFSNTLVTCLSIQPKWTQNTPCLISNKQWQTLITNPNELRRKRSLTFSQHERTQMFPKKDVSYSLTLQQNILNNKIIIIINNLNNCSNISLQQSEKFL